MVDFNFDKLSYLAGLSTEDVRADIVEGVDYEAGESAQDAGESSALLGGGTLYKVHQTQEEEDLGMDTEQLALVKVAESKIRKAVRKEIKTILSEVTPARNGALGRSSLQKGQIRGIAKEVFDLPELEDEDIQSPSLVAVLFPGTSVSTSGRPGRGPGGNVAPYMGNKS